MGLLGLRGGDHGEPGMEESAGGGLREGSGVTEGEVSAAESGVPLMPGDAGGAEGEAELRPCAEGRPWPSEQGKEYEEKGETAGHGREPPHDAGTGKAANAVQH